MNDFHERLLRGPLFSEHHVQLFDDLESRVERVAAFLHDGWSSEQTLLVVATAAHWTLIAQALELNGCPVKKETASGRILFLDAATTLARFMIDGNADPERFDAEIGVLVEQLSKTSRGRLRIYGEMVDLLVQDRNLYAAAELETLWNNLALRSSLTLLCGYSSAHFVDPTTASAFQTICGAHTHTSAKPSDLLATWLLAKRRSQFHI